MTYFKVSFQYSESTYCSNIAKAETLADVEKHYSKYAWMSVSEADENEVKQAEKKGMPIVEIAHTEEQEDETMTAYDKIIAYFEDNEDIYNETIEELDSWNGYLGDDRYYSMEELDELYNGVEPSEILQRAFFGYDEDFTDKDGNHTEAFNPNKPYFRYNGYGNLVSAYEKDYSDRLDKWFVESLLNYRGQITTTAELDELLDEYEAGN